jgi:hypothetical protein
MKTFLNSPAVNDNKAALLFAVPGAGKTTTVGVCATKVSMQHHRIKLADASSIITTLQGLAHGGRADSYDDAKAIFTDVCTTYINECVAAASQKVVVGVAETYLLHFDEVQLLMGSNLVSKCDAAMSTNLYDYVMPAFCDAMQVALDADSFLKIVLSGTNGFAPLVLNTGSQLKTEYIKLLGRFPEQFLSTLLVEYFDISVGDADYFLEQARPLRANRRAVQHLLHHFSTLLVGVSDAARVHELINTAVSNAYTSWSSPIARALGSTMSSAALATMALLSHPEGAGGESACLVLNEEAVALVKFPAAKLPVHVMRFALAGSLNVWVDGNDVLLEQPIGCVRAFLSGACKGVCDSANLQQVKAFLTTSASVGTEKGHAFERMLACELTLVDTKFHALIRTKTGIKSLRVDPLSMARPFLYHPTIHLVDWGTPSYANRVMCVKEDAQHKGTRLVDVGFPMIRRYGDERGDVVWRVLMELKFVADVNKLWRMCYAFFAKMEAFVVDQPATAVFVSLVDFADHEPKQANVKNGLSAHDSRAACKALMTSRGDFVIIELQDLLQQTVFPFDAMTGLISADQQLGVADATSSIASMHLYTSASPEKQQ